MNALIVISALVAASSAQITLPINGLYANNIVAAPYAGKVVAAAAPAIPAPLAAPSSQFQAQDELGNINYGYANINSAKQEVGNAYGGVTGSYSYVDAYGIPQRVDYIADALGFRVKATNLPVAPVAAKALPLEAPVFDLEAPVFDLEAPTPVEDTPEVKAAKAEFKKAFDEAASREKRSAVLPASVLPAAYPYALNYNLGYNYAAYASPIAAPIAAATYAAPIAAATYAAPIAAATYAAPVAVAAPVAETVSAPATREAVLTKIKLNPGHAIAYRVD